MTGDLWIPHVFMPNQNPYDPFGANAFGRWDYAPWFWPPAGDLVHGPIANPYYAPLTAPREPPVMPATPNAPVVTIADTTGRGVTAASTVSGGVVTGIKVLTVGSGYTAPTVTFTDVPAREN